MASRRLSSTLWLRCIDRTANDDRRPSLTILSFQGFHTTLLLAFSMVGFLGCTATPAAAPVLYAQAAYQSPVSGVPDDLLFIAGYGLAANDQVFYEAVRSSQEPLRPPQYLPRDSDSELGIVEVVSRADVPYSLTVRLPSAFQAGREYVLWVRNQRGEWSSPVRINDARPYWFTPAFVYATARTASLPRALKVVGRNLDPAPGATTLIRLVGPRNLTLEAEQSPDASLRRFVAQAVLPDALIPGRYRIELSRDGLTWVDIPDQILDVRPDPQVPVEFPITAAEFGSCRPSDAQDDVVCIQRAIAAASSGGGTVYFGPGEWNLSKSGSPSADGIVLPRGVALRGAGSTSTVLVRGAQWSDSASRATFTLTGHNEIRGLRCRDARIYGPKDAAQPFIKLGVTSNAAHLDPVEDVVIAENTFDRVQRAIGDSGAQIRRLFITFNEFGAYADGLFLGGDRLRVEERFRVDDSVVAHNTFKPGSFIDILARQGAIASQIGAGYRVDFSSNTADGTATTYSYGTGDARGWRAAFFWHMNDSHEMLLVSRNVATCTGDKVGDGEAIAYDNNGNTFAFERARQVVAATADTVTVAGPLVSVQNGREIPVDTYYVGHWVQVGDGPGLGQARRISSYRKDSSTGRITFTVSPRWDVVPTPLSRIVAGREFWQTYTLSNTIDNRRPLCLKSNRSDRGAGDIGLWAQSADSVVAGNRQFDSDGIFVRHSYGSAGSQCSGCGLETNFQSFVDIRENSIDGEYDWNDGCSSSGILVSLAAIPTRGTPPTVGYGLSIAHNFIRHADALGGGAIAFRPTWFEGPPPHRWHLVSNALVHHNRVVDIPGDSPRPCKPEGPKQRTGINFSTAALASRAVLYGNSCADVWRALDAGAQQLLIMCPQEDTRSCECVHVRPKPPTLR